MTTIKTFIARFARDESGVTAVEYAVLAVLLVGVIAGATTSLGTSLSTAFTSIATKLAAAG